MSSLMWYDITNVGMLDEDRVPSRKWYCEFLGVQVYVHRNFDTGNNWLLTCAFFEMLSIDIGYSDIDLAKTEALIYIKAHIDKEVTSMVKLSDAIGKEYRLKMNDEAVQGWIKISDLSKNHFIRPNGVSLCKRYRGYEDSSKLFRPPGHENDCAMCVKEYDSYMKRIGKEKSKGGKTC